MIFKNVTRLTWVLKPVLVLSLMLVTLVSHATFDAFDFGGDSQLEKRFWQISETVRCPKCQNQNISGSNAMIAQDMRKKVYQLIMEGKQDDEIYTYLVDRYGDFVMYDPPVKKKTWLLWFGPLFILMGLIAVWYRKCFGGSVNSQSASRDEALTEAEQKRFLKITQDSSGHSTSDEGRKA